MPGLHASRIAGTCSAAHLSSKRPAGEHDEDDRLAGGDDGFEQLFLVAGKAEMNAAGGFAFHPVGGFAEGEDGDVGLLGGLDGFGDGLVVVGDGLA